MALKKKKKKKKRPCLGLGLCMLQHSSFLAVPKWRLLQAFVINNLYYDGYLSIVFTHFPHCSWKSTLLLRQQNIQKMEALYQESLLI